MILSQYRIFYPPSTKTVFVIIIVVMKRKAYQSAGARHPISKGGHKSAYRIGLGDYSIMRYYRYLKTNDNRIDVCNTQDDIIVECACANQISLFIRFL